jgi:hypothetical protein
VSDVQLLVVGLLAIILSSFLFSLIDQSRFFLILTCKQRAVQQERKRFLFETQYEKKFCLIDLEKEESEKKMIKYPRAL